MLSSLMMTILKFLNSQKDIIPEKSHAIIAKSMANPFIPIEDDEPTERRPIIKKLAQNAKAKAINKLGTPIFV